MKTMTFERNDAVTLTSQETQGIESNKLEWERKETRKRVWRTSERTSARSRT